MYFFENLDRFGEKIALIDDEGNKVSYNELGRLTKEFGEALEERSLAICLCENSIASVKGYLSFLNKKVVPIMLDRKIEKEFLHNLMDVYKPRYIYSPAEKADTLEGYSCHKDFGIYKLLKRDIDEPVALFGELGLLLTTSGSTGSPKLVRQSYTNIQTNAESIVSYLEIDDTERPITTLPMNYTYGLSIINSHILAGATILLTNKPMVNKAFWDFAMANEVTSFGGVPFTYELLKRVKFFKMDVPSLRYMTQAGGKLAPELHKEYAEWAMKTGKKFIVMYGQTEATARMGYLPAERSLDKCGSMGKAIPGGSFKLLDANGEFVKEPNVVGELVYEGKNVTLGYAETPEDLDKGDERGGVLETGDMAYMDSDGYYFIVGRKKRFLKIFGNRVNLDEVDRLIKAHFDGIDCASSGIDDRMKVYVTDDTALDEVKKFLSETTHLSESAFEVVFIEEIPKNEAGKVLYTKLQ